MAPPRHRILVRRRDVLIGAGGALAAACFTGLAGAEGPSPRSEAFEALLKELAQGREPEPALLTLELPEHAENGNIVPYTLAVDSPMTDADHVRTLYLLSTANPQPKVAAFHFTPQSGKAAVTGRMRLAKTQDVVALAETSAGKLLIGTTRVEVEIGGCAN